MSSFHALGQHHFELMVVGILMLHGDKTEDEMMQDMLEIFKNSDQDVVKRLIAGAIWDLRERHEISIREGKLSRR